LDELADFFGQGHLGEKGFDTGFGGGVEVIVVVDVGFHR
jgi:hypothetical protein